MDSPSHPNTVGAAGLPGEAPSSVATDHNDAESHHSPPIAQHNADAPTGGDDQHVQKRSHPETETGDAANDAKRIHLDDDDDDDDDDSDVDELDLDTLMAQLQQHTEKATTVGSEGSDYDSDIAVQGADAAAAPAPGAKAAAASGPSDPAQLANAGEAAELSIEQQLKGALSSFQDYGLMDEDSDDEVAQTEEFGLSQLSRMLDSAGSQQSEQAGPPETRTAGQDKGAPEPPASGDLSDRQGTNKLRDAASPTSFGSKPPSSDSPAVGTQSEGQSQKSTATAASRADGSGADNPTSKEALAAKMPPLPALGGKLPPMPPPPAALTTPTAPLTAAERSEPSQAARTPAHAAEDPTATPSAEPQAQKRWKRLPEAPPTLSESYEKSLVEQLDEANKADEYPRPALLNDNQAILAARRKSIAVLDSLAAQLLEALGCNHYQETLATVTQPQSEKGLAYRLLLDAFEDAKRIFLVHASPSSRDEPKPKPEDVRPFLEHTIPGLDLNRENTISIQRANLATFIAAVFGTIEIGFWELDKWFIQAFVPEGGRLLKQQANIYLDLKTQAYISAVESTTDADAHKTAMDDLFPDDLDQKLRELLGDRAMLAPSERDFVEKCKRRRENIQAENASDLSSKYHWVPFLRELSDYIQKNHYTLLPARQRQAGPYENASLSASAAGQQSAQLGGATRVATGRRTTPVPVGSAANNANPPTQPARRTSPRPPPPTARGQAAPSTAPEAVTSGRGPSSAVNSQDSLKAETQDTVADAARPRTAAEARSSGSEGSSSSAQVGHKPEDQTSGSDSARKRSEGPELPSEGYPMFPPLPKQVLPPPVLSLSEAQERSVERARRPGPRSSADAPLVDGPTDTLAAYEAARASAEGTDAVRPRASMFTTRRTWTKEEEEALMKGMDRVQGPYWAQILELYGPGGKISEVLKDRSQVQLKDKARNLKMFFVRLGLPIPAVFQYVTGDYETRKSSGKRIRERKQKTEQDQGHNLPSTHPSMTSAGPGAASLAGDSTSPAVPSVIAANTRSAPLSADHDAAPAPSSAVSGVRVDVEKHNRAAESDPSAVAAKSGEPKATASDANIIVPSSDETPRANSTSNESEGVGSVSGSQAQEQLASSSALTHGPHAEKPDGLNHHSVTSSSNAQLSTSQGEAAADFGELFETGEDKEDDLNSLLTRVGEYVDNH